MRWFLIKNLVYNIVWGRVGEGGCIVKKQRPRTVDACYIKLIYKVRNNLVKVEDNVDILLRTSTVLIKRSASYCSNHSTYKEYPKEICR